MSRPSPAPTWAGAVALALALILALGAGVARAEPLKGAALVQALRGGGYVLLVRHASSPPAPPAPAEADPGNPGGERQLDEAGKRQAEAIGRAIRTLGLPIGEVWSSPAFRALQTVRLAALPAPVTAAELGDRGQSMQAAAADQAAWLRARVAMAPRPGTNTVIVTHLPNISAAFGPAAAGLTDGETLVFKPGGGASAEPVARIRPDDWPRLAAES